MRLHKEKNKSPQQSTNSQGTEEENSPEGDSRWVERLAESSSIKTMMVVRRTEGQQL
jgi:hypothetical protein